MDKKEQSAEEIYKANQRKSKIIKRITPLVFWGCLALSVLCFFFAIRHSFGNVAEICDMLDAKKFDGTQLQENYTYLANKFGEWVIGNGSHGFQITFINIGHAVFSGLMVINVFLSIMFLVSAYLLGKWLLPKIAEQITQDNQDMVNLTILKDHDKIEQE